MPDEIIQVEQLKHVYTRGAGRITAVDELTFAVRRGEIFGLLGPNGAGKSTVVKVLSTILKPSGGRALVDGFDVCRNPLQVRRRLAAVLQENSVETMLSVWDNLLLYGLLHGYSRSQTARRAGSYIELLQLRPVLKQRAQSLSGGFKRRVQVAKALMVETPILFLDEATTGMDPLIKTATLKKIQEQAEQGRTVILTTQLLGEAESLCQRMILMDKGRELASGTLAELRLLSKRLLRVQLRFLKADANALKSLRELGPRQLKESAGEIIMVVSGGADEWIRKIAAFSEKWPLEHFEIHGANLEEIFLELYRQ
ncbi:MAG: ABC transporter ATP-binding protein [Acidobacteria bacterium]|nr:ABC transporter ATP-binding protein [Acidobacteriota bacterium]